MKLRACRGSASPGAWPTAPDYFWHELHARGLRHEEGAPQDAAACLAAPAICTHSPGRRAAPRSRGRAPGALRAQGGQRRAQREAEAGRAAPGPGRPPRRQPRPLRAAARSLPAARGPYRLFQAETRSSASCCSRLSPQYSPTITWSHSALPLHATTVRTGLSRLRAGDKHGRPRRQAGPAPPAMPPAAPPLRACAVFPPWGGARGDRFRGGRGRGGAREPRGVVRRREAAGAPGPRGQPGVPGGCSTRLPGVRGGCVCVSPPVIRCRACGPRPKGA